MSCGRVTVISLVVPATGIVSVVVSAESVVVTVMVDGGAVAVVVFVVVLGVNVCDHVSIAQQKQASSRSSVDNMNDAAQPLRR